ncbi:MAG: DUF115 domain-containing protein [Clostridia bacterium]|nr:DUF115 domain-containing protein [Clostridia bacterium]
MAKNFSKTKHGRRLSKLKDKHKGQKCFIIGNGPSLTVADLEVLQKNSIPTFGVNRIFNIFSQTDWRPTYYICEDILILKGIEEQINAMHNTEKFIPINLHWYEGVSIEDANYFYMDYNTIDKEHFNLSLDVPNKVRCRGTVTTSCIQLAIHMGFTEIYLIGVDNNYSKMVDQYGNVIEDKSVKDYFVDNYDDDIKEQVVHNLSATNKAFFNAAQLCNKMKTFKIYNATRGGKLEFFERVDFDTLFK